MPASADAGSSTQVIIYKHRSTFRWWCEHRTDFAIFVGFMLLAYLAMCFLIPVLFIAMDQLGPSMAVLAPFIGLLAGGSVVCAGRGVAYIFNGDRRRMKVIESRVSVGRSENIQRDLVDLVTLNLKFRQYEVADYYSRKLLEQSLHGHNPVRLSDTIFSTDCWVTTPAYARTWKYNLIFIFESRGRLTLSNETLKYTSNTMEFSVYLKDISYIGEKSHPWWQKPVPMNFIVIRYMQDEETHELYLTPADGHLGTVFDTNARVREWQTKLTKATARARFI